MESWDESDAADDSASDSEDYVPDVDEQISHSSSNESDESEEEELDAPIEANSFISSKDKTVMWSTELPCTIGRPCAENIIRGRVGITYYASTRIASIRDTFDVCFPETLRKIIIKYTNVEGLRVYRNDWKDIDDVSLQSYFGLLILAGVYKSHGESLESLWNEETGRPIFRSTMSLKQFKKLCRVIRFDDKASRTERRARDKLAPIRELWDKWVDNQQRIYVPHETITIDEQLLGFRGRCEFKQYMPSKPAKYGIKFWVLCDSVTNFAWNLQVYTGKSTPDAAPEKNQGQRVVLDLIKDLKGRNLTCDSFFTTYDLALELLKRKNTIVGTVRSNKTFLPKSTKQELRKRSVFSSMFFFNDKISLVQYVPKKYKTVNVLSTFHHDKSVLDGRNKLPEMISFYNKTKAGVDTLDQLVGTYTVKRKTNRWPHAMFCNMIDISAINAYVLWLEMNNDWKKGILYKRRLFLHELGMELVKPEIQRRSHLPRSDSAIILLNNIRQSDEEPSTSSCGKRRRITSGSRCELCPKNDRKAYSACTSCQKLICGQHKIAYFICSNCNQNN